MRRETLCSYIVTGNLFRGDTVDCVESEPWLTIHQAITCPPECKSRRTCEMVDYQDCIEEKLKRQNRKSDLVENDAYVKFHPTNVTTLFL